MKKSEIEKIQRTECAWWNELKFYDKHFGENHDYTVQTRNAWHAIYTLRNALGIKQIFDDTIDFTNI